MPRRSSPPITVRPSQGERPALSLGAHRDGERALPGALMVPIEQIVPDPGQPRQEMNGERLAELAASVTEYGVLQPLLVRENGYMEDGRTRYMIVAGGRRYLAAQQAGLARLPVVVRDTEGATLRVMQLIENVQRQDLAPLEEARAFKELMDAQGLDSVALGRRLHISGQHVRDRLLLLSDQVVADAVERGQIPASVARDVLRLAEEGRAQLRPRIEAGARLSRPDVDKVRQEIRAAGVVHPRATGGGRTARPSRAPGVVDAADDRAVAHSGDAPRQQTRFADTSPRQQTAFADTSMAGLPEAPVMHVRHMVSTLDQAALRAVLQYAIAQGWSCHDLLQALQTDPPS